MNVYKTPILPTNQSFVKFHASHELNLEAICVFIATGFFLDGDTFWKDTMCLSPGHKHVISPDNTLIESEPWFNWHYTPREITFENALEEYIELFTSIVKDQVGSSPVILPLSGGLDSRSQALVLRDLDNDVHAYSYSFKGGYKEHKVSQKIAKACGFEFDAYQIEKSYLWNCIDDLATINGCYSEFTHPRQMGVLPELIKMKGVFSLGHWGDVLFDRGAPQDTQPQDIVALLLKKMVKKRGVILAKKLWEYWRLDGCFEEFLISRIENGLNKINIDNVSAKTRAFKTTQWAHRWTTTNLSVFESAHPITLPYYDNRMCEFICTIPEEYLADRRMQIAHIKRDKELSNIIWEEHRPFTINTYQYNKFPYNLPYRISNKLSRELNTINGKPYIQRNWELQFLGNENDKNLRARLFSKEFNAFIPNIIVEDVYNYFQNTDAIHGAHPLSMLLTLSLWNTHYNN